MEQHQPITAAIAAEVNAITERRAAVLKHPDLAGRLVTEIGYQRPEQWNGYIPPEMYNGWRNDSPRRAALMAISADAWNREHPS